MKFRSLRTAVQCLVVSTSLSSMVSAQVGQVRLESADGELPHLPSFSAGYQLIHEQSRQVVFSVRVLVSPYGVRIDQDRSAPGLSVIHNAVTGQLWLLDRSLRVVNQVPISAVAPRQSEAPSSEASADDAVSEFAEFLQFEPCKGMSGQLNDKFENHGRPMELWSCSFKQSHLEAQWFDPVLGVVIKSISVDGLIGELSDIRERPISVEQYAPPAYFRSVSIEELLSTVVPIGSYQEN